MPSFELLALAQYFPLCSYYVATQNSNAVRSATVVQLHVMTSYVLTATQQRKVEWGKQQPRHAHCVMAVPVSFTSDDRYDDDDNRNDGKKYNHIRC